MELTYRKEGDYLLPNLEVPDSPKIGKYGMLRRDFLRKSHSGIYTGMLLRGSLNAHLEEIDRQATEMMDRLMSRMAQQEGVNESLKAAEQMQWVARMNNIHQRAEEIVLSDLIYS